MLLHCAGPDVQDIFTTLPDTGTDTDYDAAVQALNTYFVPKVNAAFARQTFHKITQNDVETIQQFSTRLRNAAKDCDFAHDRDNQIRDAILSKCKSSYIKRKLLEEGQDLDLQKTIEIATQCERIENQMRELSVSAPKEASDAGQVNRLYHKENKFQRREKHERSTSSSCDKTCYRCGRTGHFGRDPTCPARGKTCRKCQGKDNFESVCKTKSDSNRGNSRKYGRTGKHKRNAINTVEYQTPPPDEYDNHYAFRVNVGHDSEGVLNFNVGGVDLDMLVDSGATTNVIDESTWVVLKANNIICKSRKSSETLKAYAQSKPLKVKGTFDCDIKSGSHTAHATFSVIKGTGIPLLGRKTATELSVLRVGYDLDIASVDHEKVENKDNLTIQQIKVKQQYPELCTGVGLLKDKQVTIHIKQDVTPVAQRMRRIPYHLRDKVDKTTDELLANDIIERVDGPTRWLNPVVVVPKANNEIRMCLDMRVANTAIERGRYPIPTVDEILQGLNGSTVFSKIDLKWGYHQLELDTTSRDITTFATHSGLFRYKRLFFGITSASEQYQHEIANALSGIPGVENISDDLIIHGKDQKSHDESVAAVLNRLSERGLTINLKKCVFSMPKLTFMGMLLSEKGIGPTEARVQAMIDTREPTTPEEVRGFLGLANYSARFIPAYTTMAEPLRRLMSKDTKFEFGPEQKHAFSQLKKSIANAITLAYFD